MSFIPWNIYRNIIENVPIACVDIAIMHRGRVLLVKRLDAPAKGQFWLPGGRVLKGEMLHDTAVRKAREEVGLDCVVGPLIHTAETIFDDGPSGISVHSINTCFLMTPKLSNPTVVIDDHHSEVTWVDEASSQLHNYVRICLVKAGIRLPGNYPRGAQLG